MGANMATRLKECGYKVTAVYDANDQTAADVAQSLGSLHCKRLDEVTANADVIITVVTDDASMNQIFKATGKRELTSWDDVLKPESIKQLSQCGVAFMDSPSEVMPILLSYLGLPHDSDSRKDYSAVTDYILPRPTRRLTWLPPTNCKLPFEKLRMMMAISCKCRYSMGPSRAL